MFVWPGVANVFILKSLDEVCAGWSGTELSPHPAQRQNRSRLAHGPSGAPLSPAGRVYELYSGLPKWTRSAPPLLQSTSNSLALCPRASQSWSVAVAQEEPAKARLVLPGCGPGERSRLS